MIPNKQTLFYETWEMTQWARTLLHIREDPISVPYTPRYKPITHQQCWK